MNKRVSISIITIAILLIFICFLYFSYRNSEYMNGQDNTELINKTINSAGENIESGETNAGASKVSESMNSAAEEVDTGDEELSADASDEDMDGTEVSASVEVDSSAKYLILARNGSLVVFYSDGTTEYFDTGIEVMSLPDETIDQVVEGIPFATEEELFAFLESYSS